MSGHGSPCPGLRRISPSARGGYGGAEGEPSRDATRLLLASYIRLPIAAPVYKHIASTSGIARRWVFP